MQRGIDDADGDLLAGKKLQIRIDLSVTDLRRACRAALARRRPVLLDLRELGGETRGVGFRNLGLRERPRGGRVEGEGMDGGSGTEDLHGWHHGRWQVDCTRTANR